MKNEADERDREENEESAPVAKEEAVEGENATRGARRRWLAKLEGKPEEPRE